MRTGFIDHTESSPVIDLEYIKRAIRSAGQATLPFNGTKDLPKNTNGYIITNNCLHKNAISLWKKLND